MGRVFIPWILLAAVLGFALGGTTAAAFLSPFEKLSPEQSVPTEEHSEDQESEYRCEGKPFWERTNCDPVAYFTLLLAGFTAVLAVSTVLLWIATQRILVHDRRTTEKQLRAYVVIDTMHYLSHGDITRPGKIFWSVRAIWKNAGATPTRKLRLTINADLRDTILPENFDFPAHGEKTIPIMIAPQGSVRSAELYISDDELAEVLAGRKHLYIWGSARYRDIFDRTPPHVTKFCHSVRVRGNPQLPPGYDNVVELLFDNYHEHNCADEECEDD